MDITDLQLAFLVLGKRLVGLERMMESKLFTKSAQWIWIGPSAAVIASRVEQSDSKLEGLFTFSPISKVNQRRIGGSDMAAFESVSKLSRPFRIAIVCQLLTVAFASLLLDGGRMLHICLLAIPAYWALAALIAYRRSESPTRIDLAAIGYGYLAIVAAVWAIGPYYWAYVGRW